VVGDVHRSFEAIHAHCLSALMLGTRTGIRTSGENRSRESEP
jgi:hypothetical protein